MMGCGRLRGDQQRHYGEVAFTRSHPTADLPNILIVSIDDQNDWVGYLDGHPGSRSPNLDALAADSVVFDRAYTAAPLCNPARIGVFYGLHPFETEVYDHSDSSRDQMNDLLPARPSLLDPFWAAGYHTAAAGKIGPSLRGRFDDFFELDDPEPPPEDDWRSPYDGRPLGEGGDPRGPGIDFGPTGRPLDEETDVITARWIADRLADQEPPFLLTYGTVRPHHPFRVPQRFLDEHPLDEVVVPDYAPEDLDDLSDYARTEVLRYRGKVRQLHDGDDWPALVQAYQAATTYADWCIGIVLDALSASPHADDTIVLVFSDHGLHLGEKLHLHKMTLWERATRVPYLLRAPDLNPTTVGAPVSTLDTGATLVDLCGLELPTGYGGGSLVDVVDDPTTARARPPVTTWREGNHAVRRDDWRYIRYRTGDVELYDHTDDPDELDNLAGRPELAGVEAELDAFLPER